MTPLSLSDEVGPSPITGPSQDGPGSNAGEGSATGSPQSLLAGIAPAPYEDSELIFKGNAPPLGPEHIPAGFRELGVGMRFERVPIREARMTRSGWVRQRSSADKAILGRHPQFYARRRQTEIDA